MRFALVAFALALASCAAPGPRDRYERLLTPKANPGKVIATELAFARAAQEDGQWTAFRAFATGDAVMFVPETVNAQTWLRSQSDPARSVAWQPHAVWSSCDGSLAVTRGAWQRPDGSDGYFTTVWQRQRDGDYKWVMDQGDVLPEPLAAPTMIATQVADCDSPPTPVVMSGRNGNTRSEGRSDDGTLYWDVVVRPDASRSVMVMLWQDGAMRNVVSEEVAAPQ